MKALFVEIRHGDLAAVRARLDRRPELVDATAKAPPKKDDGQSPLQVAIKTGHFDIAHLLLDRGASVDYMEPSNVTGYWRMPVLHDAIRAAVMCARWLCSGRDTDWEPANNQERSDAAYELVKRIADAGADVKRFDSFGNNALARAVLDARQVLPGHDHAEPDRVDSKPLNPELVADLTRIFHLLRTHGADLDAVDVRFGQSARDRWAVEPVARFLSD